MGQAPLAAAFGAGEGTGAVAEELAFEQGAGNGAGVHLDQGAAGVDARGGRVAVAHHVVVRIFDPLAVRHRQLRAAKERQPRRVIVHRVHIHRRGGVGAGQGQRTRPGPR